MENKHSSEDIVLKFSPQMRKFYEDSLHRAEQPITQSTEPPPVFNSENHLTQMGKPYPLPPPAPLVKRFIPNTVIGQRPIPKTQEQKARVENFIHGIPRFSEVSTTENNELIVADWRAYHSLVKGDADAKREPEVESFVRLVDSISHACGCVRGALNESAQSMYAQMLPVLQARNPTFFETIKIKNKVETLIFKEGDLTLLNV